MERHVYAVVLISIEPMVKLVKTTFMFITLSRLQKLEKIIKLIQLKI
jgi:hypothetical protein